MKIIIMTLFIFWGTITACYAEIVTENARVMKVYITTVGKIYEVCVDGYIWVITNHSIAQSFGNHNDGSLFAFECEKDDKEEEDN
jgi:hypothetical protein